MMRLLHVGYHQAEMDLELVALHLLSQIPINTLKNTQQINHQNNLYAVYKRKNKYKLGMLMYGNFFH